MLSRHNFKFFVSTFVKPGGKNIVKLVIDSFQGVYSDHPVELSAQYMNIALLLLTAMTFLVLVSIIHLN